MAGIKMNMDIKLSQREQDRLVVYVQKEVLNQIYKNIRAKLREFERYIKNEIKNILPASAGFDELINGHFLRKDLGLEAGEAKNITLSIAELIADDVQVELKRTMESVDVTVKLVDSDYSKILGLDGASFVSSNGEKVDWLEWLLKRGDVIVSDYHVIYTRGYEEKSRSKGAFMITGGGWRIPPAWSSGSAEGNIIIRAFKNIHVLILATLERLI